MIYSEGKDGDAIWIEVNGTAHWLVMGNPRIEHDQQVIELTVESSRAIRAALEAWERGATGAEPGGSP